ncbi:MAG: retropepsin-like aspartic protease [Gemmataceae bacterium]
MFTTLPIVSCLFSWQLMAMGLQHLQPLRDTHFEWNRMGYVGLKLVGEAPDRMFVAMWAENQVRYFQIDTGTPRTFINPKSAADMNLKVSASRELQLDDGRVINHDMTHIQDIWLGEEKLDSLFVGILPMTTGHLFANGGGELSGTLGMQFLRQNYAVMNTGQQSLWLYNPNMADRIMFRQGWDCVAVDIKGKLHTAPEWTRRHRIECERTVFRYADPKQQFQGEGPELSEARFEFAPGPDLMRGLLLYPLKGTPAEQEKNRIKINYDMTATHLTLMIPTAKLEESLGRVHLRGTKPDSQHKLIHYRRKLQPENWFTRWWLKFLPRNPFFTLGQCRYQFAPGAGFYIDAMDQSWYWTLRSPYQLTPMPAAFRTQP